MTLLTLTKSERAELFSEVAARRGVAPVIVEKDYWVCVALTALFGEPQPIGLIFKGGTSLSKGFGLIDRFSEDVDLAFDREGLGFVGARDPEADGLSNNKRRALIAELTETAVAYIQGDFLAETTRRLQAILPDEPWSLEPDPDDPQTLLFVYPPSLDQTAYGDAAYIRPAVRLELGARSDHSPAVVRTVTSIATEELADAADLAPIDVPMLAAERTFWEKVTLLHAEAMRERPRANARAMSRHLYDVMRLAGSEYGAKAIDDDALLERVVAHKSLYFQSPQSRYDLCVRGSLRLLSLEPDALKRLERDYRDMQVMFLAEPPPFAELIDGLRKLEAKLNRV